MHQNLKGILTLDGCPRGAWEGDTGWCGFIERVLSEGTLRKRGEQRGQGKGGRMSVVLA